MFCLAEQQDMISILRQLTYTSTFPKWKIQLEVVAQHSPQELLLSPWEKLNGIGQRCTVKGNVEESIARRVERSMTPTVFWSRARCRDWLDIVVHKFLMARSAGLKGHARAANHIYHDVSRLLDAPGSTGWVSYQFQACSDAAFMDTWMELQMHQFQYGLMLSNLWNAAQPPSTNVTQASQKLLEWFTLTRRTHQAFPAFHQIGWVDAAYALHMQAAGCIGLGKYQEARQLVLKAMKAEPSMKVYRQAYKLCSKFLSTASTDRISGFREFVQLLPSAPPKLDLPKKISVLAGADQERFALRAHGYTGPMHTDTIVQKPGYSLSLNKDNKELAKPFDQAKYRAQIASTVAQYVACRSNGTRPPDVHIGPGSETGADGVNAAFKA